MFKPRNQDPRWVVSNFNFPRRKRIERELRESEERLPGLLKNTSRTSTDPSALRKSWRTTIHARRPVSSGTRNRGGTRFGTI
jgi:hypothetical protein